MSIYIDLKIPSSPPPYFFNFRPVLYSQSTSQPKVNNVLCSVLFLFSCLVIDRTALCPAIEITFYTFQQRGFKITELQDAYFRGTAEHRHKCASVQQPTDQCLISGVGLLSHIQHQWAKSATSTLVVLTTNSPYFIHYVLIHTYYCHHVLCQAQISVQTIRTSIAYLWCKQWINPIINKFLMDPTKKRNAACTSSTAQSQVRWVSINHADTAVVPYKHFSQNPYQLTFKRKARQLLQSSLTTDGAHSTALLTPTTSLFSLTAELPRREGETAHSLITL